MRNWEHDGMTDRNKEYRKESCGICMKCMFAGLVDNELDFTYTRYDCSKQLVFSYVDSGIEAHW